jgi:tetratricopeptide (TPR) repeat protein
MKSERRHELQHNELAEWLIKSGDSLQQHQNAILSAAVVVIALLAGYWWYSYTTASQATEAWGNVVAGVESGNLDLLANVVEKFPDTRAAQMASLISGDFCLAQGSQSRFSDRANANEEFKKAAKDYEDSLTQGDSSSMQERGAYGKARAQEASGNLDSALESYKSVFQKWPKGAYAAAARQQVAFLELRETKRMFDSLRNFDPKHVYSSDVGTPGERPNTIPEESTSIDSKTGDKKKPDDKTAKPDAGAKKK